MSPGAPPSTLNPQAFKEKTEDFEGKPKDAIEATETTETAMLPYPHPDSPCRLEHPERPIEGKNVFLVVALSDCLWQWEVLRFAGPSLFLHRTEAPPDFKTRSPSPTI